MHLCQSGFAVYFGKLIIKSSKICFKIMLTKCNYSRCLMFRSNFSFTIFSLMFFLLFLKFFTNILKIYELPEYIIKYLNIAKHFKFKLFTFITFRCKPLKTHPFGKICIYATSVKPFLSNFCQFENV